MSNLFNYLATYLFFVPVYGYASICCVLGFAHAINMPLKKVNKWKLWALFTLFSFSIFFFYKNGFLKSPGFQLLRELGSSVILGFLWAWIFLSVVHMIRYTDLKPKKWYLIGMFGAIAFGLFTLIRA